MTLPPHRLLLFLAGALIGVILLWTGCASLPPHQPAPAVATASNLIPPNQPRATALRLVRPPSTNPPPPVPDHFIVSLLPPHVFTLVKSHSPSGPWSYHTNGLGPFTVPNEGQAAYFRGLLTNLAELSWDAADTNVSGTAIYAGTRSHSYSLRLTTTNHSIITPVAVGTNYFAAAHLYMDGSEGPLSGEVSWFNPPSTLGIR